MLNKQLSLTHYESMEAYFTEMFCKLPSYSGKTNNLYKKFLKEKFSLLQSIKYTAKQSDKYNVYSKKTITWEKIYEFKYI